MIRINLSPAKKKKRATKSAATPSGDNAGLLILVGMLAGWVALGGLGWWLMQRQLAAAEDLRGQASAVAAEANEIKKKIDEERLQALKDRFNQLDTAIKKLEAQRRTPTYVMHELANILTRGKLPDMDTEERLKMTTQDPDAELNQMWDASSVWVTRLVEKGDVLDIEGGARDAADLSEFVKRLRASARFADVSHPEFSVSTANAGATGPAAQRYITFTMTVRVAYWD